MKQQLITPFTAVSRLSQRNIETDTSESNWLWSITIIFSAVAAGLVNFVFTDTVLRPLITFWFLSVCPGMVLIRFLRLKEPVVEWALAVALSFAIDVTIASLQLYTGLWSPEATLSILIDSSIVGIIFMLVKRTSITSIDLEIIIKEMKEEINDNLSNISGSFDLKQYTVMDVILLFLPILALFLWSISLQIVSLNDMNDLGLISALQPGIIAALGLLVISFALTIQRHEIRVPLLVFQLICLILIVYATPNLIEEMPRFAPVYRSAGYTDYIMQTGTVNPWLDFYFNFPGFYVLSAFFTKAFGYSTILSYAGWAPPIYNLLYALPMYTIFTSITTNKRLIWLSLLFFYLTNWVGQDSFSPQGLNFFLYLVIIMILLKWFKMPPKQQIRLVKNTSLVQGFLLWLKAPDPQSPPLEIWQQRGLLCYLILIFGLVVFSHPLTPFFTLLSVFFLVTFRRCRPFWLPFLLLGMTVFWDFVIDGTYLSQHFNFIISLGDLVGNVPTSITSGKLSGDPLYHIIATMRLYMTVLLWFLALFGGIKRLMQGNQDITFILLSIAGFLLIAAQSYGGEMLLRIYFFTEPFTCFFAASLFVDNSLRAPLKLSYTWITFLWRAAMLSVVCLFLLGSFLFTRYGDERVDYISYGEWSAVQYLYQIAPANSYILAGWDYCPLYFKDYAKYDIEILSTANPDAVINTDANGIIDMMESNSNRHSYILFSQEEQILATSYSGLPVDMLQRLETSLLRSGKFKLVYYNSDAQILQFVGISGGTYHNSNYGIVTNVITRQVAERTLITNEASVFK